MYWLYSLEGLLLRMKVRWRMRTALLRGKVAPATGTNQHWSMDFVHDQMLDGRMTCSGFFEPFIPGGRLGWGAVDVAA